jgi:RecA/RadA recombinase
MSLIRKLKKNSRIEGTDVLASSKIFNDHDIVPTDVPMLNVALSGRLDGGITSGLTVIAGKSKHFKTSFCLMMAASFLKAHPDSVLLFYDSEFGSPQAYFDSFGIDPERVLHTPITDVEKLKFDLVNQLEALTLGEKVVIVVDSIGNLASKKELQDAKDEKSVADMSRAKSLKGLFRMVTPYLKLKRIPMLAINHTYEEIGLFPKTIMSGGTGIYLSSNAVWFVGRQQNKVGTEIQGYNFVINIDKSRFVKEKSKIPITVSWAGGVERYSGLLPLALGGGFVIKPSNGWYQKVDPKTKLPIGGKVREKDTLNKEFWTDILANPEFAKFIRSTYMIGETSTFDTNAFDEDGVFADHSPGSVADEDDDDDAE